MVARGEMRAGRGIIRVVAEDEDEDGGGGGGRSGPNSGQRGGAGAGAGAGSVCKFLLQDSKGALVWGVDLDGFLSVAGLFNISGGGSAAPATAGSVGNQVTIGTKILLRNGCKVDRGVVRIEGAFVAILGGKIESLEKAWKDGRIERLKSLLARDG